MLIINRQLMELGRRSSDVDGVKILQYLQLCNVALDIIVKPARHDSRMLTSNLARGSDVA